MVDTISSPVTVFFWMYCATAHNMRRPGRGSAARAGAWHSPGRQGNPAGGREQVERHEPPSDGEPIRAAHAGLITLALDPDASARRRTAFGDDTRSRRGNLVGGHASAVAPGTRIVGAVGAARALAAAGQPVAVVLTISGRNLVSRISSGPIVLSALNARCVGMSVLCAQRVAGSRCPDEVKWLQTCGDRHYLSSPSALPLPRC
jgi:hypothetical protein